MSPRESEPENAGEGMVNGKECVHCGLWFKLERAKPVPGTNDIRCPNCDWLVEGGKG